MEFKSEDIPLSQHKREQIIIHLIADLFYPYEDTEDWPSLSYLERTIEKYKSASDDVLIHEWYLRFT
jgi:hypothetical protein